MATIFEDQAVAFDGSGSPTLNDVAGSRPFHFHPSEDGQSELIIFMRPAGTSLAYAPAYKYRVLISDNWNPFGYDWYVTWKLGKAGVTATLDC